MEITLEIEKRIMDKVKLYAEQTGSSIEDTIELILDMHFFLDETRVEREESLEKCISENIKIKLANEILPKYVKDNEVIALAIAKEILESDI